MTAQQLIDLIEMKLPEDTNDALRAINDLIELLDDLKAQIASQSRAQ